MHQTVVQHLHWLFALMQASACLQWWRQWCVFADWVVNWRVLFVRVTLQHVPARTFICGPSMAVKSLTSTLQSVAANRFSALPCHRWLAYSHRWLGHRWQSSLTSSYLVTCIAMSQVIGSQSQVIKCLEVLGGTVHAAQQHCSLTDRQTSNQCALLGGFECRGLLSDREPAVLL